jgi:hypothetical protein
VTGSGQEQLIASFDKNNNRWSETREMKLTALGTFFSSFGGLGS